MASTNVKPTRMELNRAKARLKTATRGHKLLKDKRDELMRQFMLIIKQNKELRQKVEAGLGEAMAAMSVASAVMSPEMLEQALLYPKQSVEVDMKLKGIMANIHEQCMRYGKQADGYVNYVKGANVAGFMKVANAMMAQGVL